MQRSILTIGTFDGVHLGHQAILRRARQIAQSDAGSSGEAGRSDCPVIAITFDPHPAAVLRPDDTPPRLLGTTEKVARLRAAGADEVKVIEPTRELLRQSPEAFIEHLVETYHPAAIVEGPDFRFGKGRAGDVDTLTRLGERRGFQTIVEPQAQATLSNQMVVPVSSSLIRWLAGRGRMRDAALCLGRGFTLTGSVAHGERRGRELGFPTANLDPVDYADFLIPADGIYAGYASIVEPNANLKSEISNLKSEISNPESEISDFKSQRFPAAISVGVKPTFGKHHLTIEAHLLDYPAPLLSESTGGAGEGAGSVPTFYDQRLTITFSHWMRDQIAFDRVSDLVAQVNRDVARTRRWHEQALLA